MFYATWSRGFRPGGINRRVDVPPYDADFLTNYEIGWKTTFGPLRWNGAIFHEKWKKFQFAFLGANSFTEIHNGRDARINGLETDVSYVRGGLTLNAAAAYTDAKTKGNICNKSGDPTPDCSAVYRRPAGFHRCAERHAASDHAEVQGDGDGALQLAGVGPTSRRTSRASVTYRGSAPSSLRTLIELVPAGSGNFQNPNEFQGRLHAATLVDLFAGWTGRNGTSRRSRRTCSTSASTSAAQTACGSCTRALVVPGRPRTIGLRAGMKF